MPIGSIVKHVTKKFVTLQNGQEPNNAGHLLLLIYSTQLKMIRKTETDMDKANII